MAGWTKLDHAIIHSSVWLTEPHIKHTWTTMLILADKNGDVMASIPGLARQTGFSIEQTEEALEHFHGPDKYSRTKDNDGRRIETIDGGWKILNFIKYRGETQEEKRKKWSRETSARYRQKQKSVTHGDSGDTKSCHATVTVTEVTHNKNKNKNKNKKDLSDSSLRSESVPYKNIPSSVGSQGEDIPLLAIPSLTSVDLKKTKKKKRKPTSEMEAKKPSAKVWKAYSLGYQDRYGVEPKSNAKNYRHCQDLVKRVGEAEARELAQWYPFYQNAYHASRGHPLEALLKDCETIYVAMERGTSFTQFAARQAEQRSEKAAMWERIIKKHGDKGKNAITAGEAEILERVENEK